MIYLALAALFIATEWLIKNRAEKENWSRKKIAGFLELHTCRNRGMVLGLFRSRKYLPTIIQTGIFLLLSAAGIPLLFSEKAGIGAKLTLTALWAGTAGNVVDRLFRGYVVDYIRLPKAKIKKLRQIVFNLADVLILIGALAAVYSILKGGGDDVL